MYRVDTSTTVGPRRCHVSGFSHSFLSLLTLLLQSTIQVPLWTSESPPDWAPKGPTCRSRLQHLTTNGSIFRSWRATSSVRQTSPRFSKRRAREQCAMEYSSNVPIGNPRPWWHLFEINHQHWVASTVRCLSACHDALEMMRKHLLTRTGLISYKLKYSHGQYEGTRSSQTLSSISDKIAGCAARYRASFEVVRKFSEHIGHIAPELRELRDEDIQGIDREAMDDTREMSVTLSWIWSTGGVDASDDHAMHDSRSALCQSVIYSLVSQVCVLHGARPPQELIDGKKSAYCCRRRWEEPRKHFVNKLRSGNLAVGFSKVLLICQLHWFKVVWRMLHDKLLCVGVWQPFVRISGKMFHCGWPLVLEVLHWMTWSMNLLNV